MKRTARCCCEACEIVVEGEPALNAICHCDNCKRRTGSAFGWSAYFPDEKVTAVRGELQRYEVTTAPAERFFCAACGTTLYWRTVSFMVGHTGIAGAFQSSTCHSSRFRPSSRQRSASRRISALPAPVPRASGTTKMSSR